MVKVTKHQNQNARCLEVFLSNTFTFLTAERLQEGGIAALSADKDLMAQANDMGTDFLRNQMDILAKTLPCAVLLSIEEETYEYGSNATSSTIDLLVGSAYIIRGVESVLGVRVMLGNADDISKESFYGVVDAFYPKVRGLPIVHLVDRIQVGKKKVKYNWNIKCASTDAQH